MTFTPIGLVEGEYKVRTTSTAMYPTYETKNLGLNQFTVYSVPGWMSGYNEDMRKIDRYSTSIGAYIEKNLDEQDTEHELLHERINNTVSLIAYEAKRIDANTSSIAAFRVDQERQEVEFDRRITEAQTKLEKQIADGVKATTSYIARVDKKLDKYQATTTTSYMWTNQRLHTVEDEIRTIKETETGLATKVASNEIEINKLKLTTSALGTKQNEIIDKVNEHATTIRGQSSEISSLKVSEAIQDDRLTALNTQVQSNTDNIARLGGKEVLVLREHPTNRAEISVYKPGGNSYTTTLEIRITKEDGVYYMSKCSYTHEVSIPRDAGSVTLQLKFAFDANLAREISESLMLAFIYPRFSFVAATSGNGTDFSPTFVTFGVGYVNRPSALKSSMVYVNSYISTSSKNSLNRLVFNKIRRYYQDIKQDVSCLYITTTSVGNFVV